MDTRDLKDLCSVSTGKDGHKKRERFLRMRSETKAERLDLISAKGQKF